MIFNLVNVPPVVLQVVRYRDREHKPCAGRAMFTRSTDHNMYVASSEAFERGLGLHDSQDIYM